MQKEKRAKAELELLTPTAGSSRVPFIDFFSVSIRKSALCYEITSLQVQVVFPEKKKYPDFMANDYSLMRGILKL